MSQHSTMSTAPSRDEWREHVPPSLIRAAVEASDVCESCSLSFLLGCALVLAVRKYDVLQASRVLADVAETGVALSAGLISGMEFVVSQQLPSGALGTWSIERADKCPELVAWTTHMLALALELITGPHP
jgi:hypothetical protein